MKGLQKDSFNENLSMEIALVPFGDIEGEILDFLKEELAKKFSSSFSIYPKLKIPERAFNPRREQFLSSIFLHELEKVKGKSKYLGITDVDLYEKRLNFIFGEAELGGRVALISLARLREEFYGKEKNEKLLKERSLKEAVHELGHTFGLKHCRNFPCVMCFSNTIMEVDKRSSDFCPFCRMQLDLLNQ